MGYQPSSYTFQEHLSSGHNNINTKTPFWPVLQSATFEGVCSGGRDHRCQPSSFKSKLCVPLVWGVVVIIFVVAFLFMWGFLEGFLWSCFPVATAFFSYYLATMLASTVWCILNGCGCQELLNSVPAFSLFLLCFLPPWPTAQRAPTILLGLHRNSILLTPLKISAAGLCRVLMT